MIRSPNDRLITVFRICLTCLSLAMLSFAQSSYAQTPNIVFVMADDLGWTDLGFGSTSFGNQSDFYQTPNLAALAANGMSFTNAYTCGANCAPTRASLLSGQYAVRSTNNVYNVGDLNRGNGGSLLVGPAQGLPSGEDQLPASTFTMAEMLQTAGFQTAHFGKFHVGSNNGTNSVLNQGFHQNFGGGSNGSPGNYFSNGTNFGSNIGTGLDPYAGNYTSAQSQALTGSEVLTGTSKHVTDAITEATIDFIGQTQATAGSPFFLHVGQYAVHSPINNQGRPDLVAKYNALPDGVLHDNNNYAALVEGLDQGVGQIMNHLQTTADVNNPGHMLADNTMFVFYSDNGGKENQTFNVPLRGQKGEYWEGGIRVPMMISMPGLTAGGTINNTAINSTDFYQTFADVAGVDLNAVLPAGYEPLDGESLVSILQDPNATLGRASIYWHFPGYLIGSGRDQRPQSIIRTGDYKLIYSYESETYELYDVVNDNGETTNLINDSSLLSITASMSQDLRNFLIDNNAPLPTFRSTGATVPLPSLISVPEPSAIVLMGLVWLGLGLQRKRSGVCRI